LPQAAYTDPTSDVGVTRPVINQLTRMWAKAQRDGHPAEYRWHPLFNAAKFGKCPLLECHAVTLQTQNPLKFAGMPQTRQQTSADSRLKFTILPGHVEEVLLFNMFFPIVDTCLSSGDIARQSGRWCKNGDFLHLVFSASRVQHISGMHSKFTLRLHHVWEVW